MWEWVKGGGGKEQQQEGRSVYLSSWCVKRACGQVAGKVWVVAKWQGKDQITGKVRLYVCCHRVKESGRPPVWRAYKKMC